MSHFDFLNLPEIVLEQVLSYLSYDEIARFRMVCKRFDGLCKKLLNKGFVAAERFHSQSIKAVKVQLPRRESERRLHPMARHCDILSAIETRLSMLSMTFMKYVDVGLCCFIPGKVIDEIFRVLKYLKNCRTPPRAHEILQELRDISSMAMEHFDEKIAPGLKNTRSLETFTPTTNTYSSQCSVSTVACANPNATRTFFTQEKLRIEFKKIQHRCTRAKREVQIVRDQVNHQKARVSSQAKKITSQAVLIAEQDTQIAEMKRTLAEWDHKYGDLVAELSCAREECSILAAALGIVFNHNKSSQDVPIVQPCSSRDGYGGKRKLNDDDETSRLAKKSKLVDISCEEMGHTDDKILSVAKIITSLQNAKAPLCPRKTNEKRESSSMLDCSSVTQSSYIHDSDI